MRLGLLGAGVYLVALAIQVPAAWVVHWGQGAIPEGVTVSGVQGSLWHPTIDRFAVDLPRSGRLQGGPLEARIAVWQLLRGRLGAELEAAALGGEASGRAAMGWGGNWRVPRAEANLPLTRLGEVDPRLDFGQGGALEVTAEGLRGTRFPDAGSLRGTLREFRLPSFGPEGSYGTYRGEAEIGGPGDVQGRVSTASARLLGFQGDFQADLAAGTARFDGEAWVPDGAPAEARQVLALFGEIQDGRTAIRWQGRLP
ncbi:type II secretion system protein N [Thiohalorhabdus sp.]|uniref:type II secretion system protein N n=1 Tax=Thiohalorhabdus sp. TaxID=3094134 RepID=UPI002FC3AAB0